jgi:hypothetical protein
MVPVGWFVAPETPVTVVVRVTMLPVCGEAELLTVIAGVCRASVSGKFALVAAA